MYLGGLGIQQNPRTKILFIHVNHFDKERKNATRSKIHTKDQPYICKNINTSKKRGGGEILKKNVHTMRENIAGGAGGGSGGIAEEHYIWGKCIVLRCSLG